MPKSIVYLLSIRQHIHSPAELVINYTLNMKCWKDKIKIMKAAKELVYNCQGFFLFLSPILYWAEREKRVFLKFYLKQEMVDGWINEIKFPLLYPATLLSCTTKKMIAWKRKPPHKHEFLLSNGRIIQRHIWKRQRRNINTGLSKVFRLRKITQRNVWLLVTVIGEHELQASYSGSKKSHNVRPSKTSLNILVLVGHRFLSGHKYQPTAIYFRLVTTCE